MLLDQNKANKLKKTAAVLSIFLAVFLCVLKAVAVIYTDSLAVLSSTVDSLSDILASLITFFAVKISVKPASLKYRYGYGKVESLSALFQSLFVAMSGLYILYDSILRFWYPVELKQTDFGLGVMIFSLISTICLVAFQQFVAKKTNSKAIEADSLHYKVDILTNLSIIISLGVVHVFGFTQVDTIIAFFIAVYLLWNAYDLGKDAVGLLLDKELDAEIREDILKIIAKHKINPKVHDLRTRDLGGVYMFEFHLELDGELDLYSAHRYSDEVEGLIRQKYSDAQIIIHQDPVGVKEDRLDARLKD
jgi:ferrous-iron efflux pump FieF